MAEVLHEVFRCEWERHCWRGYVIGDDVSVTASSLPHARARLTEALAERTEPWAWDHAVEYVEHGVSVDVWLREALDTRAAPRARTSRVISAALDDRRLLRSLHELPHHRVGGLVVVSGVADDSVSWVCDQFESDSASTLLWLRGRFDTFFARRCRQRAAVLLTYPAPKRRNDQAPSATNRRVSTHTSRGRPSGGMKEVLPPGAGRDIR